MRADSNPEARRFRCCRLHDAGRHGRPGIRRRPAGLHAADHRSRLAPAPAKSRPRTCSRSIPACSSSMAMQPGLPEEHSRQAPGHPRPFLRGGRAVHPLSARHAAARCAAGADRLSTAEIRRSQHDGTGEVVGPYLDNPDDQSWRGPMLAYRSRMQSALDGLEKTPMQHGLAATTAASCCRTTSPSWTTAWRRA